MTLWLKETDYLFRCPYPVRNMVYGSSELLNFLVDISFKKSKLRQKMRMQIFSNCTKMLLDFYVSSILAYLLCTCFEH